MLKKRNWKEIIVYDDGSEDLASLPSSHTLFLVIKSLVEDLRSPIMLVGGIRCFQVNKDTVEETSFKAASDRAEYFDYVEEKKSRLSRKK